MSYNTIPTPNRKDKSQNNTYGILLVHIERKLGPNAKMDDTLIDPIGPVIINDFDITYRHPHNL